MVTFPDDWEKTTLGNLGNVQMCRRIFQFQTQAAGEIPFYKIGTFGGAPDAFISRELYEKFKEMYPYPKAGDVLISAAGTVGRTIVYDGKEAYFQDSNIVWLDVDRDMVDTEFLNYFYQTYPWTNLEGTTISRLYNSIILGTEIHLPSLAEQRRITATLKSFDAHISNLSALIEKKRAVRDAALEDLISGRTRLEGFTEAWAEKPLLDCVKLVQGLTYEPDDVIPFGVLVLRSSNIQGKRLSLENNVYVNAYIPQEKMICKGDILICVRNGSADLIGKNCVLPEMRNTTFGAFMSVLRGDKTGFVAKAFDSETVQNQVRNRTNATINQITKKDFENIVIPYPSIPEQEAIASVLSAMDKEISALEAERDKITQIREGVMDDLLTGRVRLNA